MKAKDDIEFLKSLFNQFINAEIVTDSNELHIVIPKGMKTLFMCADLLTTTRFELLDIEVMNNKNKIKLHVVAVDQFAKKMLEELRQQENEEEFKKDVLAYVFNNLAEKEKIRKEMQEIFYEVDKDLEEIVVAADLLDAFEFKINETVFNENDVTFLIEAETEFAQKLTSIFLN